MTIAVSTIADRIASHFGMSRGDELFENDDLVSYINQVYRFDIPNSVGGPRFHVRSQYDVSTSTVGAIDIEDDANVTPAGLYGPITEGAISIQQDGDTNSKLLRVYTSPSDFWHDYDIAETDTREPCAILIEGSVFTLKDDPDDDYTLHFTALKYRDAVVIGGTLPEREERAIEYAAAVYAGMRLGDDEALQRLVQLSSAHMDQLRKGAGKAIHVPKRASNF